MNDRDFFLHFQGQEIKCNREYAVEVSEAIQVFVEQNPDSNSFDISEFDFGDQNVNLNLIENIFNQRMFNVNHNNSSFLYKVSKLFYISQLLKTVNHFIDIYDQIPENVIINNSLITLLSLEHFFLFLLENTNEPIQSLVESLSFILYNIDYDFYTIIQCSQAFSRMNPLSSERMIDFIIEYAAKNNFDFKKEISDFYNNVRFKSCTDFLYLYLLVEKGYLSLGNFSMVEFSERISYFLNSYTLRNNSFGKNQQYQNDSKFRTNIDNTNFNVSFLNTKMLKKSNDGNYIVDQSFYFNYFEEHHKLIKEGKNTSIICKYLREDDIENFKNYVNSIIDFDMQSKVDNSIYENIYFLRNATLLEYAAFYGSIRCFKFIYLNNIGIDLNLRLIRNAIIGGNVEILHIIEQSSVSFDIKCCTTAIRYHRNNIFIWLFEKQSQLKEEKNILMQKCFKYFNYYILFYLIDVAKFVIDEEIVTNLVSLNLSVCKWQSCYFNYNMVQIIEKWRPTRSILQKTIEKQDRYLFDIFMDKIQDFDINYFNFDNKKEKTPLLTAIDCLDDYYFKRLMNDKRIIINESKICTEIVVNKTNFFRLVNYFSLPNILWKSFIFILKSDQYDVDTTKRIFETKILTLPNSTSILSSKIYINELYSIKWCSNSRFRAYFLEKIDLSEMEYFSEEEINQSGLSIIQDDLSSLINMIVFRKMNVNQEIKYKISTLHIAAFYGKCDALEILLKENNLDVNKKRFDGKTALHLSIDRYKTKPLEMILSHPSVDVNIIDNYKYSALCIACEVGNYFSVYLLLQQPDIIIEDHEKMLFSPLYLAASRRNNKIVKLLLKKKYLFFSHKTILESAFKSIQNLDTLTLGVFLSFFGSEKYQKISIKYKTLNNIIFYRYNIFQYCCLCGNLKMLNMILDLKKNSSSLADLEIHEVVEKTKETPLHLAVKNGNHEIVKFLIKNNFDVNAKDANNNTPFNICVENRDYYTLIVLMNEIGNNNNVLTKLIKDYLNEKRS